MHSINPYSIPPFFSAIFFLSLGIFVLLRHFRGLPNRAYFYWCLFTALWQGTWTILFNTKEPATVIFLIRFGYSAISILPVVYFHFMINILGRPHRLKIFSYIYYCISLFFAASAWTGNHFIAGYYSHAWGAYPRAGYPFHPLYLSLVFVCLVHGVWSVIIALRKKTLPVFRKNQIRYVLLAIIIYSIAATDYAVNYGASFYPAGVIPIIISNCVIAYAIVKHKLMDIHIAARRTSLLILVYGIIGVILAPTLYVVHEFFFRQVPHLGDVVLLEIIPAGLFLSLGPFLYAYIVKRSSYFHEHEMAGITHDLKSPLGNIQGALQFLDDLKTNKPISEKEVQYLDMIRKNTSRLEEAVNNLLTVFKIPVKTEAFKIKRNDLGRVVRSAMEEFRERIENKGLKINLSMPEPGPTVRFDEEKIRQVLSNLLSNAIKYTKTGSISVSVEQLTSDVRVTVQDTGEGIPADEIPRIFDRLFQGETSRKLKGSGLGLTIAKTWVEAHGGEIRAESDGEGRGTKIIFTLPAVP